MAKRNAEDHAAPGPRPIVILIILLLCIIILGALFALVRIFLGERGFGLGSPCMVNGPLPDPQCTPGDVLNVTAAQICVPGYARSVRNVSQELKEQVYLRYGVTRREPGQYEMDHLISLELGGSNDERNLFPEAAEPRPGFHEKDRVENWLHAQVCAGKLNLSEAQRIIATNWTLALANATR